MSDMGNATTYERPWLRLVKKHPTLAPTAVYVYLTIVGMFDAYRHFQPYGINVFEFAELNDFILAAFRTPASIVLVASVGLYIILNVLPYRKAYDITSRWVRREHLKNSLFSQRSRSVFDTVLLLIVFSTPFFAGSLTNLLFSDCSPKSVTVVYRGVNGHVGEDWSRDVDLIGTTEKFIFFSDDEKCFLIVPTSNVLAIQQRPTTPNRECQPKQGGEGEGSSEREACHAMVDNPASTEREH